jgi:hypothetical protein
VIASLAVSAVAIGLGQSAAPAQQGRNVTSARYVSLNGLFWNPDDNTSQWLDPDTGSTRQLELPADEAFQAGSCSPWKNADGEHEVVGLWRRQSGRHHTMLTEDYGLARMAFPSGKMIERISTEVLPVAPPTWFPAPDARILFATGNGSLYHLSFDGDGSGGDDRQPRKIEWTVPGMNEQDTFVSDPSFVDPAISPRTFVACLRRVETIAGRRIFSSSQVWLLKLDPAGEAVVDARPLFSEDPDRERYETRSPAIHRDADRGLQVAYYQRHDGRTWQLRVAPIDLNPKSGLLTARGGGRALADSCLPMTPAFSVDGRWVSTVQGQILEKTHLLRVSVDPERGGLAASERFDLNHPPRPNR